MKKRSTENKEMNDLKLQKQENNFDYNKKGITLINIVVLLFCIVIVYIFNIFNAFNTYKLSGYDILKQSDAKKYDFVTNEVQKSNNTSTDELLSKRQILEDKIKKEITEKINITQDLNTTFQETLSLQNKIAENDLEIAKLEVDLKELERKIIPLKKEEQHLKEIKDKKEKIAKTRLKYMYMNGKFKTLELILESKNLLEMFSNYYMLQEINGMDVKLL